MQYSYESWAEPPEPGDAEVPSSDAPEAGAGAFAFGEDLKALEESLALGLEEVLGNYRPDPETRADNEETLATTMPDETSWDAVAKMVADHVLVYLQELQQPLEIALDKARRQADEYYRDNRAMAVQIRRLLDEREQMLKALGAYEKEMARYRHLMGNMYLRN